MRNSRYSTALYLLMVFVSGAVVGGFAHRLFFMNQAVNATSKGPRSPEEYRKRYLEEMRTRLKLDESQLARLQQIMDATRQRFRELHERSRERDKPELKAIEDAHVHDVEAMLSAGQRTEYQKMRAEREKRRAQQRAEKPTS